MNDLKELLGETVPGYVFLTHTELPHTGNLSAIAKTWPEIKFVVSSAILPHVEMPWWVTEDQVQYGHAGTNDTYGGRHISFSDAILKDQPGTHWMYDDQTATLFTADAFGYLFPKSGDLKFDDEFPVIMTEKDAVKLEQSAQLPGRLRRLALGARAGLLHGGQVVAAPGLVVEQ